VSFCDHVNGSVPSDVGKFIDQIKSLYGAATDQALAERLGSTKSAIANWRRRGAIPASVQQQVAKEYGPFADGTFQEESLGHIRYYDAPRGLALYVYDRERETMKLGSKNPHRTYGWRGYVFGDIERVLRFHIRDRLADVEIGDPLMERCISDIDRRVIPELEKLLAQVRSEVDQSGLPIAAKRDR